MPLRIQCANCGKILILGAGSGTTIICPACGSVQRAPAYDIIDDLRSPQPPPGPPPTPIPPSRPILPRENKFSPLAKRGLLFVAIVALLCAGTFAVLRFVRPHLRDIANDPSAWEAAHRDQIYNLKTAAEQLAVDHKLAEARAKYAEIQSLVGNRTLSDTQLRASVEQARLDQELIYKMLLAGDGIKHASGPTTNPQPYPIAYDPFRAGNATTTAPAADTRPDLPPVPGGHPVVQVPVPPLPTPPSENIPPPPTRPAVAAAVDAAPRLYHSGDVASDDDIAAAMQKGITFLLAQMKEGELDDGLSHQTVEHAAQDALVVYALLNAGRVTHDPRLDVRGPIMSAAIERLKRFRMDTDAGIIQAPVTYGRSLRAAALAVYNRPQDRDLLAADVAWLVRAQIDGAYTYDDRLAALRLAALADPAAAFHRIASGQPTIPGVGPQPIFEKTLPGIAPPLGHGVSASEIWDNSNSNYAILGVAAGAGAGIDVPATYWHEVEKHWIDCQLDDGEWPYTPDQQIGSMAMTCGGIVSLLAAHDFLDVPTTGARLNSPPLSRPIAGGIGWLEQKDNAVDVYNPRTVYLGYNLYNIERVGLWTGFKHLGKHDWYGELAAQSVVTQYPKGSWGRKEEGIGAIVDTSFVVLFLARGRSPVMMTKLRFPPVWDNRPQDAANLARFAGEEIGQPLNWEAVGYDHDWWEWTDAPILYIASHRFPQLKEEDEAKLKAYVEAGGILFTHADAGDPSMDKWSIDLAKRLFPNYELQDLPSDSPIYTLVKQVPGPLPKLKGVSNGARLLMVHSPGDLALSWQDQAEKTKPGDFDVGLNLYRYAAGLGRLRNRQNPFFTQATTRPGATKVPVARLKYDGNWDPEPGAWRNLAVLLPQDTGLIPSTTTVDIAALKVDDYPLAHLTGVGAHTFSDAEIAALGDYVAAGGTLLIDATGGAASCGGPADFAASVEKDLLPKAFPAANRVTLTAEDPLMNSTLRGMVDLTNPRLRTFAADRPNTAGFKLSELSVGKGKVLYSPLDLTSGLLGTDTWGIVGYDPTYAQAVLKNIVVWTAAQEL